MNPMPTTVGILVIAGAVLGVLAMLGVLLANKQTRLLGVMLIGFGGMAVLVVGGYLMTRGSHQRLEVDQARDVAQTKAAVARLRAEVDAAEVEQFLQKMEEPRIDLDDDHSAEADAENVNAPLVIVDEPPSWSGRPDSDYEPDSEFAKQLYDDYDADFVLIRRTNMQPNMSAGLAIERVKVLQAARQYLALRSEEPVGRGPLGMTAAEIYEQFVAERQLVVNANGASTLHTLIAINNERGGDELVAKTRDLAGKTPAEETPAEDRPTTSRPAWVDSPPKRRGGAETAVLDSGPYATRESCRNDADHKLQEFVRDYVRDNATPSFGNGMDQQVLLSKAALREVAVEDEHFETIESSVGDMYYLFTLVEITPEEGQPMIDQIVARNQDLRQAQNFRLVGLSAGGVLGMLAVAFGVLKLDTATKGYYTKRLFLGVPAVIIGGLLLVMLLLA